MPPRGRRPERVKKLHKASKEERKGRRSHLGFLFAAAAVLGGLAASIWGFVAAERKTKQRTQELRQRLLSKPLVFSEHAACRMDCRHVTRAEVLGTLETGRLDDRRSTPSARPCPRYALQDGKTLAVFADCAADTRLVTVIDTDTDHPCGPC